MKKRILNLLLCCVILLGLMPMAVFAKGSTAPADIIGTGTSNDPYLIYTAAGHVMAINAGGNNLDNGSGVIELTSGNIDNYRYLGFQAGSYKLMEDVTLSFSPSSVDYVTVTLDLNGHVLNLNGYCFFVSRGGTLVLTDSNPTTTHNFRVLSNGLWVLDTTGGKTVSGGIITGGCSSTDNCGGGVYVRQNAAFTMKGGSIVGCTAGKNGGGVYADQSATFTMKDGCIVGCTAGSGGGVYIGHTAGFNMTGGSITDCTAGSNGGGVYIGQTASFNMSSGRIEHCTADNGGGVQLGNGTFVMSDGSITDCSAVRGGGVLVSGGTTFNMTGGSIMDCKADRTGGGVQLGSSGAAMNADTSTVFTFQSGSMSGNTGGGSANDVFVFCGTFRNPQDAIITFAGAAPTAGNGTTASPYEISTAEQLEWFAWQVNSGNTGICARLMNDIDLGNEQWTPIGSKIRPYTGTFDGNDKKITGLYVDERGNSRNAGLFGCIEIAGSDTPVVQNLTVDGIIVLTVNTIPADDPLFYYSAGILVGDITVPAGSSVEYGTIKNCHVSGTVSSSATAGGLAGKTNCTHFENCTANVGVNGHGYSGGFAGYVRKSEFKDCVAYGNVTSTGATTGGFAGLLYYETTVTHCAAYGNVKTTGDWNLGGFAGYVENKVTIKNCIAMGDVTSTVTRDISINTGAFAGVVDGSDGDVTFEKCHANGKVTVAEGKVGYGMVSKTSSIYSFKTTDCSFNSEKNPSLDATSEGAWEGIEVKNTAGVLFDVCVNYNGSHSYSADWSGDEATHWHKCSACGDKKDEAAHVYDNDCDTDCNVCSKTRTITHRIVFVEKIAPECEKAGKASHYKCSCCGKLFYDAAAAKEVTDPAILVLAATGHSGGTATCMKQAVCEVCGESYGELSADNHADLKHIEVKAATGTSEGNIEYWYCEGCDRYYKDGKVTQEIGKIQTVTAKLTSPDTGDTSNPALWIALLFVSGGAVITTTVYGRSKKHLTK